MSEVILYKDKMPLIENAQLQLYGDKIVALGDGKRHEFHFDEVSACSVLGRNKLNVYHGGKVYQFKGDERFNALKFVHTFYHYQNVKKGEVNGKFLGL